MTEYLVEVTPGREVVYRTALALRAAMRSGEITPDSRVYHRAASRWISIAEHPEYRKFLAERRPPNWLEPIPFEPAPPEAHRVREPGGLAALLRVVGRWLRGLVTPRRRPAQPERPKARCAEASPPAGRRWTYY